MGSLVIRGVKLLLLLMMLGCFQQAKAQSTTEDRIDQLVEQLSAETNDTTKTLICIELAELYAQTNYKQSAKYALKAVEYSEPILYSTARYQALTTIGDVFINSGEKQIAVEYLLKYIEEAKYTESKLDVAIGYFNLGSAWLAIGEDKKAEEMMKKMEGSLAAYADANNGEIDTISSLSLYCNMVQIAFIRQDQWLGETYFAKGKKLGGNGPVLENLRGLLYLNYGYLLLKAKRYEDVMPFLDTAYTLFEATNDLAQMGLVYTGKGDAYLGLNDKGKALDYYNKAYLMGVAVENDQLILEASKSLYGEYKLTQKSDSTLKYLTIMNEVKERIKDNEAREKLISQDLRWEYEEQQRQLLDKSRANGLKVVVVALILVFFVGIIFLRGNKNLDQVRFEKYNLELSAEKLKLDNELLTTRIEMKDKQLATEVLYRIQNNELVREMVQKLIVIKVQPPKEAKAAIDKVVHHLERSVEEKAWDDFELRFLQVYTDFYDRLHEHSPDLSVQQRRLCAFIKLNMTTKDIAAITGQSPHSIVMARSRLRKKLGLQDTDVALVEFINGL
jgi:tetratricopeptide (TPR) repeat protein